MPDLNQPKHYSLAIRRPVMMVMLFLTLVVLGWKSYQGLSITLMPDISYPTLTVRTEYEGAAPEDVEKLVTRPLEETLSIVNGMVSISSVSSPGLSEIVLEFTWGTDMNDALQEVRDRLDLFEPPKEITEKPVILRYDPSLDPVMRVAIAGSDFSDIADPQYRSELAMRELMSIREAAERRIKSDLEAEAGIAQALVKGGAQEEIQVLVDSERCKTLGISLTEVATVLAQQNINLSGGSLREGKSEYLVRTLNEFEDITEIRNSIVGAPNGRQVRLIDVADVTAGQKERETIVRINGAEAVALDIYKEGDANTVEVCNKLKEALGFERPATVFSGIVARMAEEQKKQAAAKGITLPDSPMEKLRKSIQAHLPPNARFVLVSEQARFIEGAIKEVKDSAVMGGLLALAILYLFLREWRSTLVIGLAIPISIMTTFIPMFMRDITLNIMSLGGLALGVGMLVDNSIVVLESIFRCREEGDSLKDAAQRGTHEVAGAVTASTLTTVAVFFPIAFVEGIAGQIFGDLALTVTFSLLASLLTALYLNPVLVSGGGLNLSHQRDAIWVLRAYRTARASRPQSRWAAALSSLPYGVRHAWTWTCKTIQDSLTPIYTSLRNVANEPSLAAIARCVGHLALLPFILTVAALQIGLSGLREMIITALFAASLIVIALVILGRKTIGRIASLPLDGFNAAFTSFRGVYSRTLRQSLHIAPVAFAVMVGLALHAAYVSTTLGQELIPPLKQGEFGIHMEAPPGTRLEDTELRAKQLEQIVVADSDVASVSVDIGREKSKASGERGENIAQFTVVLKNPKENSERQDEIIERLRHEIAAVSSDEITFTLPALFSFKTAVELQIRGDDLDELKQIGEDALAAISNIEGLKDPELSVKRGYPEIIVELDRDLLAARNISPFTVAQRLRTEVQGDVATQFSRRGDKVDIRVRSDQGRLSSLEDLRRVSIVEKNPPIPLSAVADITVKDGPSEIRRIDQRQVVLIQANVTGIDLGAVSDQIQRRLAAVHKPADYVFVLGGQNRELQTSFSSLWFALFLAAFLVYVVMACQFESLIHPALVMFTVPLALIGVIYTLTALGISLSVVVFIGGLVLVGIVVNNGIVLIDYINQLRARGKSMEEAIVEAGQARLRPVLMTAITTILGLVPMALWSGEGAEMRQPLAITVVSGLTVATLLTLYIVPIVYYMFGGKDRPAKS